jgi:hypothetical protein
MVRQRPLRAFYLQTAIIIGTTCAHYRTGTADPFIPSPGPQNGGPPADGLLLGLRSLDARSPKKLGGIGRRRSTSGCGHKSDQIEETSGRSELIRSRGRAGGVRAHTAPLYRGRSHRLSPAARRPLPDSGELDRRVLGTPGAPPIGTPRCYTVDAASPPGARYPQAPNPDRNRERGCGLRPFRQAFGRAAFSRSSASGLRVIGDPR